VADDNDKALVERVLAGDKAAFGSLIDRHRYAALAFARRMVNAGDAEDVVQEALLAAFLNLRTLRDHDRFRAWLLGIVANLARSRLRMRREGFEQDCLGGRPVEGFRLEEAEPSLELIYETKELHRLISNAVDTLPAEHRDAVRLHYYEGLRLAEIAILVGSPLGTIKARLHHARRQLKKSLLSELGRFPIRIDEEGGSPMTEVTVADVVLRAPKNENAKWLAGLKDYKLGLTRVVLLKELAGERILPIWVGFIEGDIIALILENLAFQRPSIFDLTVNLLQAGRVKLQKVAVTALRNNVYYASVWIDAAGQTHEIDARPSDAITLALQLNAPIFVNAETWEQAAAGGFLLKVGGESELEKFHMKGVAEGKAEPDPVEMEFRSYRSLPRADVPGLIIREKTIASENR
jgi:RNA polymerase sigma factor (sigma-70 family)